MDFLRIAYNNIYIYYIIGKLYGSGAGIANQRGQRAVKPSFVIYHFTPSVFMYFTNIRNAFPVRCQVGRS